MEFRKGDKIVCVDGSNTSPQLVNGRIYTFVKYGSPRDELFIAEHPTSSYFARRFVIPADSVGSEKSAPFQSLTGDNEIDELLAKCIETMSTKGAEYTGGSPDRLNNFREVGKDVGIPMEKAWFVFFNKHLRALESYIKNGCKIKSNESIHGRIMDLIVYLLLFEKMALEIERGKDIKKADLE